MEPGYKKISIKPYIPSDIDYARAVINTCYGKVVSSWEKKNNELRHYVEIPVNTTADLYYSASNIETITEGGIKVESLEGIEYEYTSDGYVVVKVGSGSYTFVIHC